MENGEKSCSCFAFAVDFLMLYTDRSQMNLIHRNAKGLISRSPCFSIASIKSSNYGAATSTFSPSPIRVEEKKKQKTLKE